MIVAIKGENVSCYHLSVILFGSIYRPLRAKTLIGIVLILIPFFAQSNRLSVPVITGTNKICFVATLVTITAHTVILILFPFFAQSNRSSVSVITSTNKICFVATTFTITAHTIVSCLFCIST